MPSYDASPGITAFFAPECLIPAERVPDKRRSDCGPGHNRQPEAWRTSVLPGWLGRAGKAALNNTWRAHQDSPCRKQGAGAAASSRCCEQCLVFNHEEVSGATGYKNMH